MDEILNGLTVRVTSTHSTTAGVLGTFDAKQITTLENEFKGRRVVTEAGRRRCLEAEAIIVIDETDDEAYIELFLDLSDEEE